MSRRGTEPERTLDCSLRAFAQAYIDVPNDFCAGSQIHSNEGTTRIPVVVALLSYRSDDGRTRHVMIDSGVGGGTRPGGRPAPSGWRSAAELLASAGVQVADVELLVLTHLHRDHTGTASELANARVVVQRSELTGWENALRLPEMYRPLGAGSWIVRSVDRETLATIRARAQDGSVELRDGDFELLPGVVSHLSPGGHSFGLQWLEVRTPDGPVVVASDAVMWYSNLEEMWPSGYCHGSTYQMLLTYGEIRQCVGDNLERIVPGHDPRLFAPGERVSADGRLVELLVATWDEPRV